jgi:hypothetical protein
MSELGAEAQSLIDDARGGDQPSAADRERMRGKLVAQLGAAAFASAAAGTAASAAATGGAPASSTAGAGAASGAGMFGATKIVLATLVVGALGAGAVLGLRGARSTPAAAPRAAVEAAVTPVAPVEPQLEPAPVLPAPVVAPAPVVEPAPSAPEAPRPARRASDKRAPAAASPEPPRSELSADPGALAAELALLSRAQTALRTGKPREALELVREHEQRFARGSLSQERLGIAALSRCALGDDGAEVVRELSAAAPNSPMLQRVREACGVE